MRFSYVPVVSLCQRAYSRARTSKLRRTNEYDLISTAMKTKFPRLLVQATQSLILLYSAEQSSSTYFWRSRIGSRRTGTGWRCPSPLRRPREAAQRRDGTTRSSASMPSALPEPHRAHDFNPHIDPPSLCCLLRNSSSLLILRLFPTSCYRSVGGFAYSAAPQQRSLPAWQRAAPS